MTIVIDGKVGVLNSQPVFKNTLCDFIPNKRLARISIFVRNKKYVLILLLDFSLEIGLFVTRMNQTKLNLAVKSHGRPNST